MKNLIAYLVITLGVVLLLIGLFVKGPDLPTFALAGGLVLIGIGGGMRKRKS